MLPRLLVFAAVSSALDAAPACVLTVAGGSTFDLSSLRPLWHIDVASSWWYQFTPCASSDPRLVDPVLCKSTLSAAAHQMTRRQCLALGALETRTVTALEPPAVGVRVSFTNGTGGRSAGIDIACADEATRVITLTNPGAPAPGYLLLARGREGCPLACARNEEAGAVCGGAGRGACALDAAGMPHCVCAPGFAPPACAAVGAAAVLRARAPAAAPSLGTLAAALPQPSPSLWAAFGAASALLGVAVSRACAASVKDRALEPLST
jgi:hypothetical protein